MDTELIFHMFNLGLGVGSFILGLLVFLVVAAIIAFLLIAVFLLFKTIFKMVKEKIEHPPQ
ncbi:MAG: hypothetical protein HUJ62_05605 [Streptococcus gallolyticus]|nr:hypothetical protein [Streptococcus gallolyticus]